MGAPIVPAAPSPPAEPAIASSDSHGGVLVVRDHLTYEPGVVEVIDRQIVGLAQAGFAVSGDQHVAPAEGDADAKEQEQLLAELRAEVGVKTFASKDAGDAIRAWLDRYPQFTLVVWLGRSDDGKPESWLVARKGAAAEAVSAAADAMQRAARAERP